MSRFITLIT
ncbi:Protein of unknown function [Propionibacterium freudenreichii]|nr:Protein of unknown function [Propionibacterium freudenreichii]